jgi:hypothetical protein
VDDKLRSKLEKVKGVMRETGLTFTCSSSRDGRIALSFAHEMESVAYDVEYKEEVSGRDILSDDCICSIRTITY